MRVVLDATPLLGTRTGVGNYVANLLAALPDALRPDDEIVCTAMTFRGRGGLADVLPEGVEVAARPVPARLLRGLWLRSDLAGPRLLAGPADLFHGTNFVVPPTRGPAVVTIHDLAYLRRPETVAPATLDYLRLVPRALERGAVVCTPSRAVAEQVCDAYALEADRVHPTHLGVDPQWASTTPPDAATRARLGLPERYLLAVGTLEPRKNLGILLDVLRRPGAAALPPLVLVGARGWGDALDESGLPTGALLRTGHLPYPELRAVVAGAAGLAFPSLDEGFGLPPVEALACGVPVLAADLPVTREVLGAAAAYASPSDVEAWAVGLRALLDEPVGTPESRRAHAAGYTWQACARATVAAYRQALAT